MRLFITFGDDRYARTRDFAAWAANHLGGFDRTIAYTPNDVDEAFKVTHSDIFSIQRGFGLWLWKPYLIYKALTEECSDGDYLFYCDGGAFFFRNVRYIEKSMGDADVWVTHNSLVEWQFTKRDAFTLMNCYGDEYEKTAQAQGGFLYIRKSDKSVRFIKEWLDLCCDIRLLHPDNIYSGTSNPEGFSGHREDQSILSLLCKKKGITLYQDPSQYGKYPEKYWSNGFFHADISSDKGAYSPVIILHRTPNLSFKVIVNQLILALIPRSVGLRLISYEKDEPLNKYNKDGIFRKAISDLSEYRSRTNHSEDHGGGKTEPAIFIAFRNDKYPKAA